jgi:phosphodiesterase/alkaline phosphatase D-like protein
VLLVGRCREDEHLMSRVPSRRTESSHLARYPFTLGVASGAPLPTALVIWTRLAPRPLDGGGVGNRAVPIDWEVAADEAFRRVVRRGRVDAVPQRAHSVHVDVHGLDNARGVPQPARAAQDRPGSAAAARLRAMAGAWDEHEVDNDYADGQSAARRALPAPSDGCLPGLLRAHVGACAGALRRGGLLFAE